VVYRVLSCEDIMFEGQVDSLERIHQVYDDIERYFHVITNLTAATARRYVCKACNNSCTSDVSHTCDQTCSDCMTSPLARCPMFAILVPNVKDISEVARVSPTTSCAHRRKNQYVNESGAV